MAIDNLALFEAYAKSRDNELRNEIAEKYLYIAEIMAKKFSGRGVDYDDLYQVAATALLKGIERFDYTKNLQFATFITPTVAGEIKNYFRDKSRLIRLPRKIYQLSSDIKKYSDKLLAETGQKPTGKELALHFNTDEESILSALELSSYALSLDGAADGETSFYDYTASDDNPFERLEDKDEFESALKNLSDNEKNLIDLRFKKGLSQTEVSKKWGVSQMFISRLERKIIKKLQDFFEKEIKRA